MSELDLQSTLTHVYDSIYQLSHPAACDSLVPSFIDTGFEGFVMPLSRASYDVLQGWELIVLGLVLLMVVLNKQLYPRPFRQVFQVPAGVSNTNQLLREWSPMNSFLGITFLIVYIVVMALFVQKSFVVLSRDVSKYNSFKVFNIILGCVAGWVVLRLAILYLFNWLFRTKEAVDRQVTVQLSVSTICFIVMQPVLWLLLYNPYSAYVWVGIGILAVAAMMRLVMEIIETRVSVKLSSFYIFLYFCTLEIAPSVLLLTAGLRYFSQGSVF